MKYLSAIAFIYLFFCMSCKTNHAEAKLLKYFVLLDEVYETQTGPLDFNYVDSIFCIDDKTALDTALQMYYEAVVSVKTNEQNTPQVLPYLSAAKGWAVLDANGENIKDRIRQSYIDSSNQKALNNAKTKIEKLNVQ